MKPGLAISAIICATAAGAAPDLSVTGGQMTGHVASEAVRLPMPHGPWQADQPQRHVEGPATRAAWELPENSATPLQLATPLRDALIADGYGIRFECAAAECGGFDFLFALDVLPPPAMFVDLGNFHYLAATKNGSDIAVLTSRAAASGFVHVTISGQGQDALPAGPSDDLALERPEPATAPAPDPDAPVTAARRPAAIDDVGAALAMTGHVILDDLRFASGSTELDGASSDDLAALATWLTDRPESRIALVGHTDSVGGLTSNTRLAKARAEAVARVLIREFGIAANRIEPQGIGYLAPRAPNTTAEGREANRRVEAVLLDTE